MSTAIQYITFNMSVTPLTVFANGTTDSLLTTAVQLQTTDPNSNLARTTKIAKLTGWGELFSLGSGATWPAGGAQQAQSGNGFIWDDTTLEGKSIIAGTYTPALFIAASNPITTDISMRISKRTSGGVYTTIANCIQTGVTITTNVGFNAAGSGSSISFATGDKLYIDVFLNITVGSSSNNATASLQVSNNSTQGALSRCTTPGYQ